jgi:hypothetical protein
MAPSPSTRRLQRIIQIEWIVALALTALVLGLDTNYARHAGALWRDEANSFVMATYPSLATTWQRLQFDSFPMLWYVVLRGWIRLGLGQTDMEFRAFGLIVNVGIIAILWLNAWRMSRRPPLVAVTLLGANAAVMMFCGSVRGYGLGVGLGLWMYGAVWAYLVRPGALRWMTAAVAAVLACHMLYYNCVFVAAACLAGATVAVSRRRWRAGVSVIAIGAVAAATLLVYLPAFRSSGEWRSMYVYSGGFPWLWEKFVEAVDLGHPIMRSIWVMVAVCAALGGFHIWRRTRNDLALFAAISVIVGVIGNALFLRLLNYYMQPWYFLSLMAVVAAAADAAHGAAPIGSGYRSFGISAGAVVLVLILVSPLYTWSVTRRTNLDEVARILEQSATKGDYIVLMDWTHGITLHRYYHGLAAWQTLVPLPADAHDIHRSDLAFSQMHRADAIGPVLDSVVETLRAGHSVFYVGHLPDRLPSEHPRSYYQRRITQFPPPSPVEIWRYELDYSLGQLASRVTRIPINLDQPVSSYEALELSRFDRGPISATQIGLP